MQNTDRQLLMSKIEPIAKAIGALYPDISRLLIISETFNRVMIDHIEKSYSDDLLRNKMLVADLQTRGPNAFKTFVEVLELIGCTEALKIVSPKSLISGIRGTNNNIKHNNLNSIQATSYPLGMFSYNFSTPSTAEGLASENDLHYEQKPSYVDRANNDEHFLAHHQNQCLQQPQQQQKQQKHLLHWHPYPIASDLVPKSNNLNERDDIDRNSNNNSNNKMTIGSTRAPNAMAVKNSILCHNDPNEDYMMISKPRGMCLIINNMKFDGDILPERKGSDIDATRFVTIFKQLWFEVYHELNLTANDMKDKIDSFASMCKSEHDALIVIILSHGSDRGLYGSDGLELDPFDIFSRFDNDRCKLMEGKPKIFIFQACRGTLTDFGEMSEHDMFDEAEEASRHNMMNSTPDRPPLFTRSIEFSNTRGARATQTDMLICYSCLPGYVSVRNEIAGSWLGTALGYYLMTCSWEKDLEEILAMVSKDFEGKVSSQGHKQAIEIKYLGWRKRLFFNPGIYQ